MRICSVEDCNEKHYGKGLCQKHYRKQYNQEHKEEKSEYRKQYYLANKEKEFKQMAKWKQNNEEHLIKYRKDNKEHKCKYNRQYRKTPAGKASDKAGHHNRRTLTKDLIKETILCVYEDNIKKYGVLTCYLCGKPIIFGDKELKDSLDHSTPVTREGSNNYDNLGIAHLVCNLRKGTMTLIEWFNNKREGK